MTDHEREFEISDEFQQGVSEAFQIAVKWLQENDDVLFLYFMEDGNKRFSLIQGCTDQTQVLDKVRSWARASENVDWFIQISCAVMGEEAGDINAVVAHCLERRPREGFVLVQKVARNSAGRLEPVGDIDYVSRIPNNFFSA
jgi:hypothetical protein